LAKELLLFSPAEPIQKSLDGVLLLILHRLRLRLRTLRLWLRLWTGLASLLLGNLLR